MIHHDGDWTYRFEPDNAYGDFGTFYVSKDGEQIMVIDATLRPSFGTIEAKGRRARRLLESAAQPDCQWFHLCDNPATDTTPHPILGDVDVCRDCKRFAEE